MGNKRTMKALEELVKTEYMAVGALDAAIEEVDDNKLRKQYRKFRDQHMKQAEALNDRLEELGGERLDYEVGSGKGQATLWGKLTGLRDDTSVEGMRVGAERGIKRYMDHIDEVDDAKALKIIRKNLEAKQDEMDWYDDQASRERAETLDTKLQVSRERARDTASMNGKKGGGLPFPLLIVLGAIGAAAFFLLRRSDEEDYDEYDDAFAYEGTESTGSDYMSATAGGASDYNPTASHGSNGGA